MLAFTLKKLALAGLFGLLLAPQHAAAQQIINLYAQPVVKEGQAPANAAKDKAFQPRITLFRPEASASNGKTVLCLPGGAYTHLATGHEGTDWAPFFNQLGFTFVMLEYRMPHGDSSVPMSDVVRALSIIREHAAEWGIQPDQIGIMGSSAGGHLASTAATRLTGNDALAFQILFYPVISMQDGITHRGSQFALLGADATEDAKALFSNERQVNGQTPRAILLLSSDDTGVPPLNAVDYYLALQKNKVSASLHIYPTGGHGWGKMPRFAYHEEMEKELTTWLKQLP